MEMEAFYQIHSSLQHLIASVSIRFTWKYSIVLSGTVTICFCFSIRSDLHHSSLLLYLCLFAWLRFNIKLLATWHVFFTSRFNILFAFRNVYWKRRLSVMFVFVCCRYFVIILDADWCLSCISFTIFGSWGSHAKAGLVSNLRYLMDHLYAHHLTVY